MLHLHDDLKVTIKILLNISVHGNEASKCHPFQTALYTRYVLFCVCVYSTIPDAKKKKTNIWYHSCYMWTASCPSAISSPGHACIFTFGLSGTLPEQNWTTNHCHKMGAQSPTLLMCPWTVDSTTNLYRSWSRASLGLDTCFSSLTSPLLWMCYNKQILFSRVNDTDMFGHCILYPWC